MKFSKDGIVKFDSSNHTYWRGTEQLCGVTSFISKYKEEFDMDSQAERFALKNGLDKDTLIKEWTEKGQTARDEGTAIHKVFEDYIQHGETRFETGNMKQFIATKFIWDYFKSGRLTPVECEMVVYGEKLASMIDCIARNEKGEHFIFDWKSSKEVSKNGYGKRMFEPFKEYDDCNFIHYSIQVSIYRQLCREYDIKDAFIVHISSQDYEIIQAKNILTPKHLL